MIAGRRQTLKEFQIRNIVRLLESTDTEIPAIAVRMGCSPETIRKINRQFGVRNYAGKLKTWTTRQGQRVAI